MKEKLVSKIEVFTFENYSYARFKDDVAPYRYSRYEDRLSKSSQDSAAINLLNGSSYANDELKLIEPNYYIAIYETPSGYYNAYFEDKDGYQWGFGSGNLPGNAVHQLEESQGK
jgi:hypothetical protein